MVTQAQKFWLEPILQNGSIKSGGKNTTAKVKNALNKWYQPRKTDLKMIWAAASLAVPKVPVSKVPYVGKALAKVGSFLSNWKTILWITGAGVATKAVGWAKDFYEENKETIPEQSSAIPTYTPSWPSDAGWKVYGPSGGSTSTQVQSYIDKYKDRKADDIENTGTKTSTTYVKRTPEELRALMKEKNPNMIGTQERKQRQNMIDTYAESKGMPKSSGVPLRKDIETFKTQIKTLPKEDVAKLIASYKSKNI